MPIFNIMRKQCKRHPTYGLRWPYTLTMDGQVVGHLLIRMTAVPALRALLRKEQKLLDGDDGVSGGRNG